MLSPTGGRNTLRAYLVRFSVMMEALTVFSVSYDVLKRHIYQLEKRQHGLENDLESNERYSLLQDTDRSDSDSIFIPLLDKELRKIIVFYESQQKESLDEIAELEEQVKEREEAGLAGGRHYFDDEEEDEDEDDDEEDINAASLRRTRSPKQRRRKSTSAGYSGHNAGSLLPCRET
jgi:phosphate transporter